jgi:pyruvate-formate lyase-activating enzyme
MTQSPRKKPALLCIVPPYSKTEPPAAPAYLLAFLKQQGCEDFTFLDLRLAVPDSVSPTYTHTSVFGESFVMDIPDLPLVLKLLDNYMSGNDLLHDMDSVIDNYALYRAIPPNYLKRYLRTSVNYLESAASRLAHVEFIGLSTWTSNLLTTYIFCCCLKRRKRPPYIVLGGPQVTQSDASAALALRSGIADVVALGEGEALLSELYGTHRAKKSPADANVAGSLYLAPDRTSVTAGDKRVLLPIGQVSFPDFSEMALVAYQRHGWRTIPYHFSRGCTDRCVFCSEWHFWQRFRPGEVEATVEGFEYLAKQYGAEEIAFTDSLLNGHPKRLVQFAEELVRRKNKVEWSGFMRANMTAETSRLLKRAGCYSVFIGVESMSDETLAAMKKRRTEADNANSLEAFLSAGISVVAGVIPGFPTDKRDAYVHTVSYLADLQSRYPGLLQVNVEPFIVSPGQPMSKALADFDLRGVPWSADVCALAPVLVDIASTVLCSVEGSNQGTERSGRLRLAEALEVANAHRADVFDYKIEETIRPEAFSFEYVSNSRHLAQYKSKAGSIVGLIVDDSERELLEEITAQDDIRYIDENAAARRTLRKILASHELKPSPQISVTEGYFALKPTGKAVYSIAPTVVARRIRARRWLVCDVVTARYAITSRMGMCVLKSLSRKSGNIGEVLKRMNRTQPRITQPSLEQMLSDFRDHGFLHVHEAGLNGEIRVQLQPSIEVGDGTAVPQFADSIKKDIGEGSLFIAN